MSDGWDADTIVVGAGPAGVGVGVALSHLDLDVLLLERDAVGASLRSWPEEMRFITPSFPSNGFDLPDLNAIVPETSPAVAVDREHPSGDEYAEHLEALVGAHGLTVGTGVEVTDVRPIDGETETDSRRVAVDGGIGASDPDLLVETDNGSFRTPAVVWAGGQFGTPRTDICPGSEHGRHNSAVASWDDHLAASGSDEFLVIGGFESGIDAAVALIERGASVTVLDRGYPWAFRRPDPSETLSPYTLERLDTLDADGRLSLIGGVDVERIERAADGSFEVVATDLEPGDETPRGSDAPTERRSDAVDTSSVDSLRRFPVPTRPILATGFEPNLGPVDDAFPRTDGTIDLTDRDESPTTPGLFLVGPDVTHNGQKFCFIYKYRTRFPVVAETIGERLGVDTDPLDAYRESNMFLEDLSCCEPTDCRC